MQNLLGRLSALLITLLPLAVCGADPAPTVLQNITYKTIDGVALQLDLAVPPGDGPFPAIVILHGGGWGLGHRRRIWLDLPDVAAQGFVAATVSYRLAKTGEDTPSVDGFPAALQDVKAAIRFLRANSAEYAIDPQQIGITGDSAGGHLALLAALTRPADGLDGPVPPDAPSAAVQAVVDLYGPTDLARLADDKPASRLLLVPFMGGLPAALPDPYRRASPLSYVRRDAPPILMLHGTADPLVPLAQSQWLDTALTDVGAPHRLVTLSGAGHGFRGNHYQKARQAAYDFFRNTLGPRP